MWGRFFAFPFAEWPSLFRQSWAGDMWGFELRELRPVTALSFMIDARCWEGNAFGFRLTNLLLHGACAAMVGILAWRAAERDLACGMAAALLFALHPAHAEPVQWITGAGGCAGHHLLPRRVLRLLALSRRSSWGWAAALTGCYAASAFSKEFGLLQPAAEKFAKAPRKELPHESWRALINELTTP